ncbi:MAG: hypothetical protein HY334_03555 [Armatimonadetes bacterium]|nr:hypothetical protein [Armatimonadota bacterium]
MPVLFAGGMLVVTFARAPTRPTAAPPGATMMAQDTTRELSAGLLRRLAAAADGYRTGTPVYVVASYASPHTVVGVFESRERAQRIAREYGRTYDVFGPYVTPRDYGRPIIFLAKPHCDPTIYSCEADKWLLPKVPWAADDIDSVTITAYHRSGETWHVRSPRLQVDAVFFTLAAHDKFVFPYYAGLVGTAYADSLRQSLGAYIQRAPGGP